MLASVDVTNIQIETQHLILRGWQMSDLDDLYTYAKVDGVGQMAGWAPHQSLEESRSILTMFIAEKKTFAVVHKETGRVIGSVGLEEIDFEVTPESCGREIGYVLSKDFWGKGFMPEAVNAVISYCFSYLHFDWITCGHYTWNHQSQRVVEKCNFQYVTDLIRQTHLGTEEIMKLYVLYNPIRRHEYV